MQKPDRRSRVAGAAVPDKSDVIEALHGIDQPFALRSFRGRKLGGLHLKAGRASSSVTRQAIPKP